MIPEGFGPALPGVEQVHHVEDSLAWTSVGRTVSVDGELAGQFPPRRRDRLEAYRPWRRIARVDKCVVRPTPWGLLGIRGGWGYCLRREGPQPLWPFHSDAPLRGAIAVTESGAWVGEYTGARDHGPIVIWHIRPDLSRVPAHVFPAGAVRHVHRVQVDPLDGALWATTGDRDGACWLWRSDDGFRTVERLGDGTQRSRATHLCFTESHVAWGTDTELGVNHVVRLHRRTGQLETGMVLPAPVWSGALTTDGWHLIATGVERGPGVRTRRAQVFASRDAWHWQLVASLDKDRWPHRLGKHGLLWFPTGRFTLEETLVSGEALRGLDGSARPLDVWGLDRA